MWINLLMDDHQCGNIANLRGKKIGLRWFFLCAFMISFFFINFELF